MFVLTPIVIALIVSTVINVVVTVVSWRRRKTKYGLYFTLSMVGITFWTLMAAFDYAATSLDLKILFATLEGWGYMSAHPLFVMFALSFAGYDSILKKRWARSLLFFVPVSNILLVTTNGLHGWVWQDFIRKANNVVVFVHGPAYWWIYVTGNLLNLIIIISLTIASLKGSIFSKRQGRILLTSVLFVQGANIAYNTSFGGVEGVDWTSVAFSVTGVLFLWALYGQKFLDIVPIAREMLIDGLRDGMVVLDLHGRIVDINQPAAEMLNSHPNNLIGKDLGEFIPFAQALSKQPSEREIRTDLEIGDTDKQYVDVLVSPLFENQKRVVGHLIIFRDITSRKENELHLLRLTQAVEQSPTSIVITDFDGNITYVNPQFTKLTGYSYDEAIGKNPNILQSGQTSDKEYREMWQTIKSGQIWKGEFLNKKKNGDLYWEQATLAPVLDHEGRIINFIAVKADITERKHAQNELQRLARTDPLTEMFNRRYFFDVAVREFSEAIRYNKPLSVIILDLDLFKKINDTYGHLAGDQALIHIGKLLQQTTREPDISARYGGEEFVVLLPETDCTNAIVFAERLRILVEDTPIQIENDTIRLAISIGIAGKSKVNNVETFDQLISQADQALYEAKRKGRNRVVCYVEKGFKLSS